MSFVLNEFDSEGGSTSLYHHMKCAISRHPDDVAKALKAYRGVVPDRSALETLLRAKGVEPVEVIAREDDPTPGVRPERTIALVTEAVPIATDVIEAARSVGDGGAVIASRRTYSFERVDPEMPCVAKAAQSVFDGCVAVVPTSMAAPVQWFRSLRWARLAGLSTPLLWVNVDLSLNDPARDRIESAARALLEALGWPADEAVVLHTRKFNATSVKQLADELDAIVGDAKPAARDGYELAVETFEALAQSEHMGEARYVLRFAAERSLERAGERPKKLLAAASRVLTVDALRTAALDVLRVSPDESTGEALLAYARPLVEKGHALDGDLALALELLCHNRIEGTAELLWPVFVAMKQGSPRAGQLLEMLADAAMHPQVLAFAEAQSPSTPERYYALHLLRAIEKANGIKSKSVKAKKRS